MEKTVKRIKRSRKEKILAGVCGGIGEYFNIDPVLVRLLFVALLLLGGWTLLAYIIAWVIIPKESIEVKNEVKNEIKS